MLPWLQLACHSLMMQHFSVTNRIRHILKQSADINRVLNEIKKYHVFKDTEDITKEYYRTNKLITEKKKIINKTNRDQDS